MASGEFNLRIVMLNADEFADEMRVIVAQALRAQAAIAAAEADALAKRRTPWGRIVSAWRSLRGLPQ